MHAILDLALEDSRLRQNLSETQKEADKQRAMFALLDQILEEVLNIKSDVSKLLSHFTQARNYRISQKVLAHQREIEMDLLKVCGKDVTL